MIFPRSPVEEDVPVPPDGIYDEEEQIDELPLPVEYDDLPCNNSKREPGFEDVSQEEEEEEERSRISQTTENNNSSFDNSNEVGHHDLSFSEENNAPDNKICHEELNENESSAESNLNFNTSLETEEVEEMMSADDELEEEGRREELQPSTSATSLKMTFKLLGDKTICRMSSVDKLEESSEELLKVSPKQEIDDIDNSVPQTKTESVGLLFIKEQHSEKLEIDTPEIKKEIKTNVRDCNESINSLNNSESSKPKRKVDMIETGVENNQKLYLACVPARSAAVKALNKLRPLLDTDSEVEDKGKEDSDSSYVGKDKVSETHHKVKSVAKVAKDAERRLSNETTSNVTVRDNLYSCNFCKNYGAYPLRKVKSHLANHHPSLIPTVIDVVRQRQKRKSTFYLCPFSSCKKLFGDCDSLNLHKPTHSKSCVKSTNDDTFEKSSQDTSFLSQASDSLYPCSVVLRRYNRKSKTTKPVIKNLPITPSASSSTNSSISKKSAVCSRKSISPVNPNPKPVVKNLHISSSSASSSTSSSISKKSAVVCPRKSISPVKTSGSDKYECLYCTENYSDSTLLGIKTHYASEHPSQLLVLRDVQAKKEKQISRVYACEEAECEYTSVVRTDLDSHAKCHKSNCTYVYECAGCGWYSSSFWTAKDHLRQEHSDEENPSLVHMQLSVDENGQTTRKVLSSL